MSELAALLENLIKQMVENVNEVGVEQAGSTLEVRAHVADLGIIIGKSGKNIRSLRNLINLKTAKEGLPRVEIKIREEPS